MSQHISSHHHIHSALPLRVFLAPDDCQLLPYFLTRNPFMDVFQLYGVDSQLEDLSITTKMDGS
jgi:hypothetical protein